MTDFRAVAKFSDKVVLKDEYGDTVSFEVDEGEDSDFDNKFYMVVHEGDTNNVIEWLYTREQLTALIQFLVEHTVPDASLDEDTFEVPTNDDVIKHVDEAAEMLDRIENTLTKLENRLATLLADDDISPDSELDGPAIVTPPNNFPARVSELGTDPDKFAKLFEETFTTNPVSRIDKEALSSWFEMAIDNGRKEAKKS